MESRDGSFYKPNNIEKINSMYMFPAFNEKEIGLTNESGITGICSKWNDTEYLRANQELIKWENMIDNGEREKRVRYFADVIGKLDVWYYEKKITPPNAIKKDEKLKIGFQTSTRKLTKKNYDNEINKLIKCNLRFYKDANNKSKQIEYKLYAQALGKSAATITRRFTDDKFLKRLNERIEEILSKNFPITFDSWNLSDTEKDILLILFKEIGIKRLSLSRKDITIEPSNEKLLNQAKSKNGNEILPQSSFKESTISDKASHSVEYGSEKENIFRALDGVTKINRRCNKCGNVYKVEITEDDDIEKWEKEAKKNQIIYRQLVCSDNCYKNLIEKMKD